ncbi:hypothetical protein SYNPS1DRAFT_27928 [Syncephalis pseudoplumigaleata]|uniref:Uncharacterized protein n=1 Tax=Syncephalis pseudoplumigaleata TaxID=1712513 RepID=A0A4V1J1V5_9FUNG|nr:hypothetical protein SYNPS1DRAFT_27928 [Syncephalis pseudoplumigaleata]|eukprot:RKP26379.1 hypothetical protein SYNPS1DRAFT_27928 [Syncephalis pseudoplumigaleata]
MLLRTLPTALLLLVGANVIVDVAEAWPTEVGKPCGMPNLFLHCVSETDYLICSASNRAERASCDKGLRCAKNTHIGDLNYCRAPGNDGHRADASQPSGAASTNKQAMSAASVQGQNNNAKTDATGTPKSDPKNNNNSNNKGKKPGC